CSGLMPCCLADCCCCCFWSKSRTASSRPTGKPLTWSTCLPSAIKVTVYLPGSMPREKYSPFLLVLSEYLRPLSWFFQSRTAPAIGFPCASLQTPFTVPVAWANPEGTYSAASNATRAINPQRFFILASHGPN